MSSTVQQIPGYYYDQTRRRYFRVQADHAASNASARQYSRSSVKTERERERETNLQKERAERQQRRQRTQVVRSKLIRDSCISPRFVREWGIGTGIDPAQHWFTHLYDDYAQAKVGSEEIFLDARYDNITGTTICSNNLGLITAVSFCGGREQWEKCMNQSLDYLHVDVRMGGTRYLVGSSVSGNIALMPRFHQSPAVNLPSSRILDFPTTIVDFVPHPDQGHLNSSFGYAIAGKRGYVIQLHQNEASTVQQLKPHIHSTGSSPSDTISALWKEPTVLVWGFRDGGMLINDLRFPEQHTLGYHHDPVRAIRKISEHHFIAAGLGKNLCMYDIRCMRAAPGPAGYRCLGATSTRAYLKFNDYESDSLNSKAFDISTELNLVVSANGRGSRNKISVFDLWTGKKKPRLLNPREEVNSIHFAKENVTDGEHVSGIGLCVATGDHHIGRWYCGESPDAPSYSEDIRSADWRILN